VAYEAILTEVGADELGPILRGPPLYKLDSKGKLRIWYQERQEHKKRTVAGLQDGALTTSAWTECVGKQKRDDVQQAVFEINADYTHGLKREYFDSISGAEGEKRFFKPQLAEKWAETTWDKWVARLKKIGWTPRHEGHTGAYFQPKLDGFCCIAQKSGLTSREGQPIIAVPHVMEALAPLFEADPDAVFHGELYNHALKEEFETLSSILKKTKDISEEQYALSREMAQFHIYDYAAPHVRDLPFGQRSEALLEVLKTHVLNFGRLNDPTAAVLHFVETIPVADETQLIELFGWASDEGFEGGIGRLDGPYHQGRCWWVIKIKLFDDAEFDVVEVIEGVGNYQGYAKAVRCWAPDADRTEEPNDDNTFKSGIKGKRDAKLAALLTAGHKVVTIRYFRLTNRGVPRMGVAIKWHGEARTL
jgi:DNA ligase-1